VAVTQLPLSALTGVVSKAGHYSGVGSRLCRA